MIPDKETPPCKADQLDVGNEIATTTPGESLQDSGRKGGSKLRQRTFDSDSDKKSENSSENSSASSIGGGNDESQKNAVTNEFLEAEKNCEKNGFVKEHHDNRIKENLKRVGKVILAGGAVVGAVVAARYVYSGAGGDVDSNTRSIEAGVPLGVEWPSGLRGGEYNYVEGEKIVCRPDKTDTHDAFKTKGTLTKFITTQGEEVGHIQYFRNSTIPGRKSHFFISAKVTRKGYFKVVYHDNRLGVLGSVLKQLKQIQTNFQQSQKKMHENPFFIFVFSKSEQKRVHKGILDFFLFVTQQTRPPKL